MMKTEKGNHCVPYLLLLMLLPMVGCQTLKEIASLRKLDFAIAGVETPRLAGVDLSSIRAPEDLSPTDMLRLGTAVLKKELPLDITLLVSAQNPENNSVDARVVGLDWTLLLDDHETISGFTESDILIPPGMSANIPVVVSVNLIEFFDEGVADLINLALSVSGAGGPPTRVKLRATPTIDTVIGPIRYPEPITIVSRSVGG